MGAGHSFAEFALARLPGLARRLDKGDVVRWLAGQDSLLLDGTKRWIADGDRLRDEAEMKLDWARRNGLIDEVALAALQDEYGRNNPDTEAVAI
jgi:hypothetical protein